LRSPWTDSKNSRQQPACPVEGVAGLLPTRMCRHTADTPSLWLLPAELSKSKPKRRLRLPEKRRVREDIVKYNETVRAVKGPRKKRGKPTQSPLRHGFGPTDMGAGLPQFERPLASAVLGRYKSIMGGAFTPVKQKRRLLTARRRLLPDCVPFARLSGP